LKYGNQSGKQRWCKYLERQKKKNSLQGYIEKHGEEKGREIWFNKNLKNSKSSRCIPISQLKYYVIYCIIVDRFTSVNKHNVTGIENRSRKMHLDHKISKMFGFLNNIPPYIIGSHHNLEMLTSSKNSAKSYRNSMTLEELFEKFWLTS
jgi:hypothetical protein